MADQIDIEALMEMVGSSPSRSEAEIAALRRQQGLGMLLGGSSVGGGNVGQLGRQMYKSAEDELYGNNDDNDFNRLMKVMTLKESMNQRDISNNLASQRLQDAQEARDWRQQQAEDARDEKQRQYNQGQAQKLEKSIGEDFASLGQDINNIRSAVAPYLTENPEDIDLPGYGFWGRKVPDFLAGEEARSMRSQIGALRNKVLAARSGAAVTEPEAKRLLEELGDVEGASEIELLNALNRFQAAYNDIMEKKYRVYGPEATEIYLGGEYSRPEPVYTPQPSSAEMQAAIIAEQQRRAQQNGGQ
jgi:hypothetical protein